MNIKIVTDSTSDLPAETARELGITVLPAYVHFGSKTYRDRLDISEDEFYHKLENSSVPPTTEPPTPDDFAGVYRTLSKEADGIISIHISGKLSATCNSAQRGRDLAETKCPIEIIDSKMVTMGLGLLALAAHSYAKKDGDLQKVTEKVKQTIPDIHLLGLLDTLKYLAQGGRIGKATAFLGSMLSIKPLLTMKEGEIEPVKQVRSRSSAVNELFDFARSAKNIQDIAIVYNSMQEEVSSLTDRLESLVPRDRIRMARLGSALAVHTGPSILFIALHGQM